MKVTVYSQHLAKVLGLNLNVLERKSTIPVLSNILIEPNGAGGLRITGTDLDVTAITKVQVEEIGEGSESICVPGKKLQEIIRSFPSNTLVEIEKQENHWIKLKANRSNFRIAGVSGDNYPEIPKMPATSEKTLRLPARKLVEMIELVQFAVTTEHSRFTLSGAKLMVKAGIVRLVATDGNRLALAETKTEDGDFPAFDELIPKKALSEILKVCRDVNGDEAQIRIESDNFHLYFEIGDSCIVTRKLSGSFPNYETVIPKNNDRHFVIAADVLLKSLQRVRLMADERTISVKFGIKKNELQLEATSAEEGEATEHLEIAYDGEEVIFGINGAYGQDYLAQALNYLSKRENKNLVVHFKDGNTQLLFKLADESEITHSYVLMPLRL